jgi:hypothetical protein
MMHSTVSMVVLEPHMGLPPETMSNPADTEEWFMLYDNIYYLGCLFQTFLRDHPNILDSVGSHDAVSNDAWRPGAHAEFSRRFLEWLGTRSSMTDMAHQAMLLHIVDAYKAGTDVCDTSHALVAAAS